MKPHQMRYPCPRLATLAVCVFGVLAAAPAFAQSADRPGVSPSSASAPAQPRNTRSPAPTPSAGGDRRLVDQKLLLVARMMKETVIANRAGAPFDAETKQQLAKLHELLLRAHDAFDAGQVSEAETLANEALIHIGTARRGWQQDAERSNERARFHHLVASARSLHLAYEDLLAARHDRRTPQAQEDEREVSRVIAAAQKLAGADRLGDANQLLQSLHVTLAQAYSQLQDQKIIVYAARFDDPERQFRYELARARHRQDLIPIAILQFKPKDEAVRAIEHHLARAKALEARAHGQAAGGGWQTGIATLAGAIGQLDRALAAAGVVVPERVE